MKKTLSILIPAIVVAILLIGGYSLIKRSADKSKETTSASEETPVNTPKTGALKVLLINGSPNEKGCTFTALSEVAASLNAEGVETEIIHIGKKAMQGCTACGACKRSEGCAFDDLVNVVAEKAKTCDGLIFGSPVYYASANGSMLAFLDRLFYSAGKTFAHKPGAAVVSARRAGTTAALDCLNKYFTISEMPVVSSQYWNMVFGNTPEEVKQDLEGMQIMRTLGKNMAWLLKTIEAGKAAGIELPQHEKRLGTNFIR
ncbi:MAG: flavodoxin family protein [Bacteroidales bacterium]|jgi:multimeric flavodoxin WrbA|nr:flavodoxin family protein [Bacteroidales bacterium]